MAGLFQLCENLQYLDLSNFNTSNVIEMQYMFSGCTMLKEIKGIDNFITNKVENMSSMFESCNELKELDLSNMSVSNVTNMRNMFYNFNDTRKIKGIKNFITNDIAYKEETLQMTFKLNFQDSSNCNYSHNDYIEFWFKKNNTSKEINGINKFIKDNMVMNILNQFYSELESLYLSNNKNLKPIFGDLIFYKYIKVEEIKGVVNFITNKRNLNLINNKFNRFKSLDIAKFNIPKLNEVFNGYIELKEINGIYKLYTNRTSDIKNLIIFYINIELLDSLNLIFTNEDNIDFIDCLNCLKLGGKNNIMLSFEQNDEYILITNNKEIKKLFDLAT